MTGIDYRRLYSNSKHDINEVQKVFVGAPSYFCLVEGSPPGPGSAAKDLQELPAGKSLADKYFFGIRRSGEVIGCMDVIRGYPELEVAYIGLLLLVETEQGKSYGVHALRHIKSLARQWGCKRLRIAVVENNERAIAFWMREGFAELYRKPSERYVGDSIVMECILTE